MIIKAYDSEGCQMGRERWANERPKVAWAYLDFWFARLKVEGNGKDIYDSLGAFCILQDFGDKKTRGMYNIAMFFAAKGYTVEWLGNGDLWWGFRKIAMYFVSRANAKIRGELWVRHCNSFPRCCICNTQDETVGKHEDTGELNWCDECYSLKQAKDARIDQMNKDTLKNQGGGC